MASWLKPIRRFLTAEEVPRWFGLSLVLIYLVGLGTVARYGITLARRDAAAYYVRSSEYAIRLLADRLQRSIGEGSLDDPAFLGSIRVLLREFCSTIPAKTARLVRDRRIVASSVAGEQETDTGYPGPPAKPIGELAVSYLESPPAGSPGQGSDRLIRVALPPYAGLRKKEIGTIDSVGAASRDEANEAPETDSASAQVYLEVVLPPEVAQTARLASQAATLAVILVVLGALFVVYRCLREQLRGVWRIADRLESHRNRIQEDLASLRIADALDGVTAGWNELVGFAERLMETVRRAEANDELSRVLERSGGGAIAEALHALPDGLILITEENRFEYLNSTACRLLGWNPEECRRKTLKEAQSTGVGRRILELARQSLHPDGTFESRAEIIESDGADGESIRAHPGQPPVDRDSYRVVVIPLQRARQHGECIVLIRDISQQLRADQAREEFVAQVTHELRTPLTNIRAYAETLSSGMFDDPHVITECYNVITKETRRLTRLIEDILSVSQLEVGTIELRMDQVDLKTLLSDGVRDVRGLAEEKNIDLQWVCPAKLEPIRGDRDKLAVVINNLLGNAIKYTPPGGTVVVGCKISGEAALLTFKDNGIGIAPKDHARIFEKFQRGSSSEVLNETGTGIGLFTAREIVRRHSGRIDLISEAGKGATFLVRLPTGRRGSPGWSRPTLPDPVEEAQTRG